MDINKMKDIVYDIFDKENIGDNKIFPITFREYYNNYYYDNKLLLLINNSINGYNDLDGNIFIFLDRFNKLLNRDYNFICFLETCYHEIRHSKQLLMNSYSYDKFLIDMDLYVKNIGLFNKYKYLFCHNSYSFEIGANIYGIEKAIEYLKDNYCDIYYNNKNYIDKRELYYKFDYYNYDARMVFSNFINVLRRYNYVNDYLDISPVISIILNRDYSFKSFHEIYNDIRFNYLDDRLCSLILSNNLYLNEVYNNNCSEDELDILRYYISYGNKLDINRKYMVRELNKKL